MRRNIDAFKEQTFDVLVVGGGILGAFLARCAALRGYSVGLLEKSDFASGTSSGSGKVAHGGIRYLQGLDVSLIGEAQREQEAIARLAPELVRPIRFLAVPGKDSLPRKLRLGGAAWTWRVYRELVGNKLSLERSEYITVGAGSTESSWLETLDRSGALAYSDLQLRSPERLVVALLRFASSYDAEIANYTSVTGLEVTSKVVQGVRARDRITGESFSVRSRFVVNAAGAWAPDLESGVADNLQDTQFAKGTHAILDRSEPEVALAIPVVEGDNVSDYSDSRARRIFVMPWEGHTLVGATYSRFRAPPAQCAPERIEIGRLLKRADEQWPGLGLQGHDVLYSYSGLYPLFDSAPASDGAFRASRSPRIVDHEKEDGVRSLISVMGVKFTTARALAQKVMELVEVRMSWSSEKSSSPVEAGPIEYARPTPLRGIDRISDGLLYDQKKMEELVALAVEAEMALTLEDVLFRRTWIGHLGKPDVGWLERMADYMADLLDWSPVRRDRELMALESIYDRRAA